MSGTIKAKVPVSKADAYNYNLSHWQEVFGLIFNNINEGIKNEVFHGNSIAYSKGHIISNITGDLGDLGEQIRIVEPAGCIKYIASMFAWICALCNEWKISLEEILWEKYEGVCPYCCKGKDCDDAWWTDPQLRTDKEPTPCGCKDRPKKVDENQKPTHLEGWLKMFKAIYGRKIKIAIPISDIMYKLYEEETEVLKALDNAKVGDQDSLKKLKSEIPDFLSWVFGIIIKLEIYHVLESKTITDILYEKFKAGCSVCSQVLNEPDCKCTPPWL